MDKQDPLLAVLAYRNTPTEGMTSSPIQRMIARRTRTQLPIASQLLATMPESTEKVQRQIRDRQKRQSRYYNRHAHQLPDLLQGNVVRMRPSRGHRWERAIVMRKVGPRSYEVQTESGTYRRNRQHLRLQDWVTSPEGNSNEEEPEEPETMEEGNTQKERAEEDHGGSQESGIPEPAVRRSMRTRRRPQRFNDYEVQFH